MSSQSTACSIVVDIKDVNEPPAILPQSVHILENSVEGSVAGTLVGTAIVAKAVVANDPESATLTYQVTLKQPDEILAGFRCRGRNVVFVPACGRNNFADFISLRFS